MEATTASVAPVWTRALLLTSLALIVCTEQGLAGGPGKGEVAIVILDGHPLIPGRKRPPQILPPLPPKQARADNPLPMKLRNLDVAVDAEQRNAPHIRTIPPINAKPVRRPRPRAGRELVIAEAEDRSHTLLGVAVVGIGMLALTGAVVLIVRSSCSFPTQ